MARTICVVGQIKNVTGLHKTLPIRWQLRMLLDYIRQYLFGEVSTVRRNQVNRSKRWEIGDGVVGGGGGGLQRFISFLLSPSLSKKKSPFRCFCLLYIRDLSDKRHSSALKSPWTVHPQRHHSNFPYAHIGRRCPFRPLFQDNPAFPFSEGSYLTISSPVPFTKLRKDTWLKNLGHK